MSYAACGQKVVRDRRWWPAYQITGRTYRYAWMARAVCAVHMFLSQSCGETWVEVRADELKEAP